MKRAAAATPTTTRKKKAAGPAAAAPKAIPAAANDAWLACVRAAEEKKATEIKALDLRATETSFTDYLVLCSAANPKQAQAVADEVERQMKLHNDSPLSVEGYSNAEWILLDFGDMVVNVFTETARSYYDLDRLFRDARVLDIPKT